MDFELVRNKPDFWLIVIKQIITVQKFNIPISIDISIKTHPCVCIRQALSEILDIIGPLNQHFKLKKPKKLTKTSLNVKILECD